MRILILLPINTLGGAEQYLKMVALNHNDEDVQIFILRDTGTLLWKDLPESINITFLSEKSKILGLLKFIKQFIFSKKNSFDYIFTSHVFMTATIGILVALGLIKKKFFVARESTSIIKRFSGFKLFIYKLAYQLGYGKIDLLICQTTYMQEQLLEQFPRFTSKTRVIANPIDLQLIQQKEIEPIEFDPPANYIVSAGRFITEKGYDILIKAFKEIKVKNTDIQLLILGEGEERQLLEGLASQYNLEDAILMPGRVDNVYPFFKAASLCVISSRIEGFPNVLLQMMSQNNKVVSTLCAGGIEELEGVYTCPTEDFSLLAAAMEEALKANTSANRNIFNEELNKRAIESFLNQVKAYLIK